MSNCIASENTKDLNPVMDYKAPVDNSSKNSSSILWKFTNLGFLALAVANNKQTLPQGEDLARNSIPESPLVQSQYFQHFTQ
jgi:hypothetical protein